METDKWITPDEYHFRDLLDNGRCLYCGKLAGYFTTYKKREYHHCKDHADVIEKCIDEISA